MVTAEISSSIMAAGRTPMPQGFRMMIAGSLNFKIVGASEQPSEVFNLPARHLNGGVNRSTGVGEWRICGLQEICGR
jgi:hypothetical protein